MNMTESLSERVTRLVAEDKQPLLSTTPTSLAIKELAARIEAVERAVQEIAAELSERTTSV